MAFAKRMDSCNKIINVFGYLKGAPDFLQFIFFSSLFQSWGETAKVQGYEKPLSSHSARTYENRFGLWHKALKAFIAYIDMNVTEQDSGASSDAKISRNDSEKQPIRNKTRNFRETAIFNFIER